MYKIKTLLLGIQSPKVISKKVVKESFKVNNFWMILIQKDVHILIQKDVLFAITMQSAP